LSFTSIPTLADGAVLTASHMNIIANNVNDLIARGEQLNLAFPTWGTGDAGAKTWQMRRKHRYLKVLYGTQGTCDYVKLFVNDVLRVNDDPPSVSATMSVDLSAISIAVGAWYPIVIQTAFVGSSSLTIWRIWEQPTA
jgi:hypothetical protein